MTITVGVNRLTKWPSSQDAIIIMMDLIMDWCLFGPKVDLVDLHDSSGEAVPGEYQERV